MVATINRMKKSHVTAFNKCHKKGRNKILNLINYIYLHGINI